MRIQNYALFKSRTQSIKIGNSTTIKKNSFDTQKCIKAFCFEFCIR